MKSQSPSRASAAASLAGVAVELPGPRVYERRRTLGRIRDMSLVEIAVRGQQEATKWIERIGPTASYEDARATLRERAPALSAPEAARRWLMDAAPRRLFAGLEDPRTIATMCDRMPDACRGVIAGATDILTGAGFDVLGYRMVSFGDPIDWHLDPIWTRRAPFVHWSQIDALDPAMVGDSKVVWELNRHQWVVQLAQAWALTGDTRYADAAIAFIDAWLEANPPSIGINWASSLEVSYRLIAWCWTMLLLRDAPAVTGEWLTKLLAAMWYHASHIRRYLSYYFSPNTHLTGEALGLFYAGVLLREFPDAMRWRELGARILVTESRRQV